MSPRHQDPNARMTLIDAAARLVAEGGPSRLSSRRLAEAAGTSTTAVYTYFGSMSGVVREIVRDGFERLQSLFDRVQPTGDPVSDLALLGRAYRYNAMTSRHVFEVMFGGSNLAGFALSEDDRQHGRYTLAPVVEATHRCVADGRFRAGDPALVAHHMWTGVHGTVVLELGGYLVEPYNATSVFETQLVSLMIGAGDEPDRAGQSVACSGERFSTAFGATT